MSVRFPVGPLLLCAWFDPLGRARRATFAPEQLKLVHAELPAWVAVAARLAAGWRVSICTF